MIKSDRYGYYLCPIPDCNEELYLTIEGSLGLSGAGPAQVSMADCNTSGWKVECLAGHVVLLPPPDWPHEENAIFGRSCDRCRGIVEEDPKSEVTDHDDYARLEALYAS